jgi:hypothetical protein
VSIKRLGALVLALGLLTAVVPATTLATSGSWNATGTYGVNVKWDQDPVPNTIYPETLILTQSGAGTITGTSLCLICFDITGGSVVGDAITIVATSPFTLTLTGTIASDGSMAGTWADGAGGLGRTGTWATTDGAATFVPTPTATIRLVKHVLPADDSLWNFVITNGNDITYRTYTDETAPFDSAALTIDNPTAFEIDEWAGTGTDIADYQASVACTDNGVTLTPTASTYYDVGSQHRFYVYFIPAQAGHNYVCTFTNTNPYDFAGFFAPVDNLPVLNAVKAGQAIPVKFSLGGNQGLDVFWAGYPKSSTIACASTATADALEETVAAGSSSLSYDSLTKTYTYVWKTDKAWAGTCRQLQVKLADGTSHFAKFQFTR